MTGDYNIELGDAAIKNGESFTMIVETTASGWANQYGTGLVSTSNPYGGSNGADNFRMYFGRPGHNNEPVVFGFNNWEYNSREGKLTGVDMTAAPVAPSQDTPLTLGMIFTYDGSKVVVTNSENSQVKFAINENHIVSSFNFSTLTNTGAASMPNAETFISITKAYTAPVVPEPTTATLSLLALAGLAARRRRK
ncbi:MAG: PEP-CTERM sorting domain-containing protein [Akkermansia sp.]|nr:PEP-CTERM sorting domain-containing protein [Akkermansia sp.]